MLLMELQLQMFAIYKTYIWCDEKTHVDIYN